ncbi:4'-phosphopantetheinyl transferase family protein [Paenibacillus mendelii]|uniref:4'-phosphopantetheinyl transferase family protein n=1 Tax=Paenibacillus mendelii TaxID=206163 RepID=A0ABV6J7E4_9BACL|nr:4'-phosphopantetheinyl transferase superfamily protein [Paenibacillus mendelii]MCQ6562063.1 4'-phosphopantetheinyl transferase superfamily protein [Paenibacillus mendelii]
MEMPAVYAARIGSQPDRSFIDRLLAYLPPDKQARIGRFRKFADAQRTLLAEIVVRNAIVGTTGTDNRSIRFDTNCYGKPHLKNSEYFNFNISHSGEWVVCVFGRCAVGIDVEQIGPIDIGLAERYFSPLEYSSLMSRDPSDRIACFYDLWTLKESYVKAVGKGLSIPLDAFTILIERDGIRMEGTPERYFFRQYGIDAGYRLSVCSAKDEFPACPVVLNAEDECVSFIRHCQEGTGYE